VRTFVDEFDVGDSGVGFAGNLLFELFDSACDSKINLKSDGLLFGGSLEQELNHLKK